MRPHRVLSLTAAPAALAAALAAAAPPGFVFKDVTREAGIAFDHIHGGSGEKHYVETMGSGACWFDHDGDGDIDLYAVNSGPLPGYAGSPRHASKLYRNEGGGRFTDVTAGAGVANEGRYGMGCVAGDIDGDGDRDLYVTNFGPNVMYRNEGGGRFTDVTAASGTGDPRWSASAAFGDIDNDGDLDLYVTNYIDFTLENNKFCGERKPGHRAYCHPDEYNGVPDSLYRNRGDGRFDDVSAAAGVADPAGKGLGVVFTDIDDDGWQDIYVANDKTINFLYRNRRDGTFEDISLTAGTGFSESGLPQAGMGTDAGDVNGDGRMDLVVTNLDYETNELYLNNGDLTFSDVTFRAGLGEPNYLDVGFGADFLDADNDGDEDLLVVNGHILDNIHLFKDKLTYMQPRSLMANDGTGTFREIGPLLGPDFTRPDVGRGLAVGDHDDDGDLDLFVVNNNRPAQLLHNDGGNAPGDVRGRWISIRLRGVRSNTDGIGARVKVTPRAAEGQGKVRVPPPHSAEVRAGSSYLSQNDVRLHFGLGGAGRADIEVRWPSGTVQRLDGVEGDRIVTITEAPPAR
ncbi:MAG TPA: CRTAC1 family protein [Candidatus Polarisedimenticolia bacterium]|nr:CRTAC1 family protein [Candidatus Polarisedimenticolia bacterium]